MAASDVYFIFSKESGTKTGAMINTRFSCKKFAIAKVSTSVSYIIPGFLSFYFRIPVFFLICYDETEWSCNTFCKRHTGKVRPRTLRLDPGNRTLVGPQDGTLI